MPIETYVPDCGLNATYEAIMSTHRPTYSIEMNDGMDARQRVDITRNEFIAVKKYLCELRGLKPAGESRGSDREGKES
jgi:hypothetical protein